MNNYEYIIASLPDIDLSDAANGKTPEDVTEFIREQLSEKDKALMDILLEGRDIEKLGPEFYAKALACKNRFLREFFLFDLQVRNEKVRHLNRALGREAERDIVVPTPAEDAPIGEEPDFSPEPELADTLRNIYSGRDILEKERAIDLLIWNKIDELTTFDDFDLDAVLAFLAKLQIILRWLKLDEETGREMMRTLLSQVRGSYEKLEFNA